MWKLRKEFIEGEKGPTPAAPYLGKTRAVYEFVRGTLGVKWHGLENLHMFAAGTGVEDISIGQKIAIIYEVCLLPSILILVRLLTVVFSQAIRDGKMQPVVAGLFA